jgi:5'-nucleotidase
MRIDFREWLDTINSLPPDLKFVEPADMAKELVPKLREQGADIIVALTHMVCFFPPEVNIQREPNDVRLAKSIPEGLIDIILGGHDHYVSPIPHLF